MKLLLAIISIVPKTIKDFFSSVLVCAHKAVDFFHKFISISCSRSFPSIAHRALGIVLLDVITFISSVNTCLPATPFARKWSSSIDSDHSIFFLHLSVFAWQTMVELRKFYDAFFACISRISEGFNFRAEKKDQFMLLKEYKLSNSKFHQSLVQGDLTLSN